MPGWSIQTSQEIRGFGRGKLFHHPQLELLRRLIPARGFISNVIQPMTFIQAPGITDAELAHQPVPVIPLSGLVTQIGNQALHL